MIPLGDAPCIGFIFKNCRAISGGKAIARGETGPIPIPGIGDAIPIPGIDDADPIPGIGDPEPMGLGARPPPSIEVGLVGSPFREGTGDAEPRGFGASPPPSAPAGFDGNPLIDGSDEFGAIEEDAEFSAGRSEDAGTGGTAF